MEEQENPAIAQNDVLPGASTITISGNITVGRITMKPGARLIVAQDKILHVVDAILVAPGAEVVVQDGAQIDGLVQYNAELPPMGELPAEQPE